MINSLVQIAKTDSGDRWIRNSVLSSSTEFADRLFSRLVGIKGFAEKPLSEDWLAPLARVVGGEVLPRSSIGSPWRTKRRHSWRSSPRWPKAWV